MRSLLDLTAPTTEALAKRLPWLAWAPEQRIQGHLFATPHDVLRCKSSGFEARTQGCEQV
jgi:hypothetical protein